MLVRKIDDKLGVVMNELGGMDEFFLIWRNFKL